MYFIINEKKKNYYRKNKNVPLKRSFLTSASRYIHANLILVSFLQTTLSTHYKTAKMNNSYLELPT